MSLLLTLLSAALYAASFPPLSLHALAWVALVPFFVALSRVRPARAAALGVAWSATLACGVGWWWFPSMVTRFFEGPAWIGWAALLLVAVACCGLYLGLFAAWLAWLARRAEAGPVLVAAGWGACEFARARLLMANPWALAGYSQAPFATLVQVADVTGVYGIGMLIAAVNAALASALVPALRPRRAWSYAAVAGACVLALAYGTWRLATPFAAGEATTVAVVQAALDHEFRRRPDARAAGLRRHLELTRGATGAGLVVWPEYAVDVHLQDASPERAQLLATARDVGADVLLGGPSYRIGPEAFEFFNSVFLVHDGRVSGRYDKRRLLPVAEDDLLASLLRRPALAPGSRTLPLRSRAGAVAPLVCFEAMYPELVRPIAAEADVLANLSNDSWFGDGAPAEQHLQMAAFRAIENRRFLVRAVTTGVSAVVDPHGRVVARSRFGEQDVLVHPIRRGRGDTVYRRIGDAVAWMAVAIVAAASLRAARRAYTGG